MVFTAFDTIAGLRRVMLQERKNARAVDADRHPVDHRPAIDTDESAAQVVPAGRRAFAVTALRPRWAEHEAVAAPHTLGDTGAGIDRA
jgi:hypothetical protein